MITAEQLIAIATAHGTDFQHIAGTSSKTDGPARRRRRTREEVRLGLDVCESVTGRQTRVYRRPTWSLAELGGAAGMAHVSNIPWLAARYSYAGDVEAYWELWFALLTEVTRIGRRAGWGPRVRGADGAPKFYCLELVSLVLDVEAHRSIFDKVPNLYAWYLGVTQETWSRLLEERYGVLAGRYERWLGIARAQIQRCIADGPQPAVA